MKRKTARAGQRSVCVDPKKRPPRSVNSVTEFQRRVYEAVSAVPKGHVTTYKMLAAHVQRDCSQAVGQALRRNPFAPIVPCHRVIASDLTAGGFAGRRNGSAVSRKLKLLAGEGVLFRGGKLADIGRLHLFRKC